MDTQSHSCTEFTEGMRSMPNDQFQMSIHLKEASVKVEISDDYCKIHGVVSVFSHVVVLLFFF